MQEPTDAQLLRDYAEHRNETAFRELVHRHADVVYASALRQVTSPDLAHDIAQSVFTDLARKAQPLAGTLTGDASLLGWLFRSTRFLALNQLRDDRRRQVRERQAMENFDPAPETAPEWERVQPVIDEAMADLSDEDREALLLRFFKNRDFRAIGAALGVSDDAAQKRVSRALERLRTQLTSRGVTTTAIALSTVLSTNAVTLAPAGLAVTLSTAALAGTTLTTAATATTIATHTTMNWLNFNSMAAILAAAIAAGTGTHLMQQRESNRLRSENENLTAQQAQLTSERDAALASANNNSDELNRLRKEKNELLRLRGEIGPLRAQSLELEKLRKVAAQLDTARTVNSRPVAAALEFPRASWAFAGSATPEAACQSSFWALSKGDTNAILNLMTPEEKVVILNNWDSFSMGLSNAPAALNDTKGFSILSKQIVSDDEVVLDVRLDGINTNSFQKTTIKRYGSEWKILTTTVHEK
ncbi:MAG: sigma-70 family RNA polymerase sigma factor [Verrucomicrobiota bacterium]